MDGGPLNFSSFDNFGSVIAIEKTTNQSVCMEYLINFVYLNTQ